MGAPDGEGAVADALQMGKRTWPDVQLSQADFAAWVREQAIPPEALAAHGSDLLLAAACARGEQRAIARFDEAFLQTLTAYTGRPPLRPDQLDELKQRLRVHLLTGPDPRIARYQGRGPLSAWVRVAAARLAIDLQGRGKRRDEDGGLVDALLDDAADPELVSARTEHRAKFQAALESCLSELAARQKTLLRMHFLDRMSIDEIGVVFRVHRATVARWLVAIRQQVFKELCARLTLELRSSASEVASLVRLVQSDVELSIRRLLVSETSPGKSRDLKSGPGGGGGDKAGGGSSGDR